MSARKKWQPFFLQKGLLWIKIFGMLFSHVSFTVKLFESMLLLLLLC